MSISKTHISSGVFQNTNIAASIEISPKHALEMDLLDSFIPQNTRVYISDVGTHNAAEMALGCRRVTDLGLIAVPHIAARRLTGFKDLENRIKRYADVGVQDVLVIGGTPTKAEGPVTSTMDVLSTGLLDANGIQNIGIAGHPEGTPDFSDEVAISALRLKQQFSERSDAELRIVTQFGFDPEVFINWAMSLAEHNIDLPVHLGVAGPAKITTLIKYAAMCGVGNSINFLRKRASILTTLATSHSPEAVVGPIEDHTHNAEKTNIFGIHAYPFGGVKKTAEWLQQRGSWNNFPNRYNVANKA